MPLDFTARLSAITDSLSRADGPEDSWNAIVAAAQSLGAVAVNGGGIHPESRTIHWGVSSMAPDWLQEYTENRYHEVDPLLWGMRVQRLPELHSAGAALPGMPQDPRLPEMRAGLLRHGYHWFWAHLWREGPYEKMISIATTEDLREHFGPDAAILIRMVSALMAARLTPPDTAPPLYGDATGYAALSPREKDALRGLAEGLDNVRLAERMGVAEVTVRMHLRNARRKMGAGSREQALALALARGALTL